MKAFNLSVTINYNNNMLVSFYVTAAFSGLEELKTLYDSSFPDDERIPFRHLLNTLDDDRIMMAYYDNAILAGMSFVFLNDDLVYLSYICVAPELRDQGYGSRIIQQFIDQYPDKSFILDIEEVKPDTPGWQMRQKRKNFYLRNGFKESGIFYHIYNVDYELLTCNGPVTQKQWHALIRKHWGKIADTAVYR